MSQITKVFVFSEAGVATLAADIADSIPPLAVLPRVPEAGGGGGGGSAFSMKIDASSDVAYVEKNWGSDDADVWIEFQVGITPEALALWLSDIAFAPSWFARVLDTTNHCGAPTTGFSGGLYDPDNSNAWTWRVLGSVCCALAQATSPGISASTWFTLELHITGAADGAVMYVNGTLVATCAPGGLSGPTTSRKIRLGMEDATPAADNIIYFKDLKVGTTRHGSDLFADDFSSEDLSNWGTTTGDCSVVANPF